jgi:branched-chain amino acid transport system permease protein
LTELIIQTLFAAITEGCIYALMGLGLVIIHRTTEVMYFPQGSLAMISGVTLYALTSHLGASLVVSLPIALIVTIAVALATQLLVVRPLLNRGASAFSVSMGTIGLLLLLDTIVMILFGKDPLPVPPFSGDKSFLLFGASVSAQEIWLVATTIVSLLSLLFFFKKTWIGKAMTGLGTNPLLAKALGIPVGRLFSYSFILAALVGGLAGAVSAPISYTGYWIGTRLTIKGFVAAAVGGINNPLGAVAGGIIIGFIEAFGAGFISSGYKDLITIVLLLLVLAWRPEGLLGER